ncbi:hypothetical protein [Steroidobacter denitrificans]|nr:hypothetical protein [Steroidobacter denitrificans]
MDRLERVVRIEAGGIPDRHHVADKNKAKKLDNKSDCIHAPSRC